MRPRAPQKARPSRKTPEMRPAQIDRMRDTYVSMIVTARRFESGPNAFLDKAHKLLTTHWAHATWTSRAAILKSVDWLVKVGIDSPRAPQGPTADTPLTSHPR